MYTTLHSSHDETDSIDGLCIACLMEVLEDKDLLQVKKKVWLIEFVRVLRKGCFGPGTIHQLLSDDGQLTISIIKLLIGLQTELMWCCLGVLLNEFSEDAIYELIIEALMKMVVMLQSDDLTAFLFDNIAQMVMKSLNYKSCIGLFNLTGRLMSTKPGLRTHFLQQHGDLVDYIVSGLGFNDVAVQLAVTYVCIQLYSKVSQDLCPELPTTKCLVRSVMKNLQETNNGDLLVNLVGLMKVMLDDTNTHQLFLSINCPDSTVNSRQQLAFIVKRMLLSHRNPEGVLLQVATVQTIVVVLSGPHGNLFATSILQADIAEFLFEALNTKNEILIGSIFCALHQLTECPLFFTKCHAVYGIDPILRSLDLSLTVHNAELTKQGFQLLVNILERQSGDAVRLFNAISHEHCLDLVGNGIKSVQLKLSCLAALLLYHLLKPNHLPIPISYKCILDVVDKLVCRVTDMCSGVFGSSKCLIGPRAQSQFAEEQHRQGALEGLCEITCTLVSCIHQLARLVSSENSPNHILDTSLFEPPNSTVSSGSRQTHYDEFCLWLLNTIDEVCLPLVMKLSTSRHLLLDIVYAELLGTLIHLYSYLPTATHKLDSKLIGSGFMGFLLVISAQYQSGKVKDLIVDVLYNMILPCVSPDSNEVSCSTLRNGLPIIKGSWDAIAVQFISENHLMDFGANWHHGFSFLCLLFASYLHGDRCLNDERLLQVVDTFLCMNETRLKLVVPSVVRITTYLYAMCLLEVVNDVQATEAGLSLLVTALQQYSDVSVWCQKSPEVLRWIFSIPPIRSVCGQSVIFYFVQSGLKDDVLALASDNVECLKVLAIMLTTVGDQKLVTEIVDILLHIVVTNGNVANESTIFIHSFLPDLTQKMFLLSSMTNVPALNLKMMLQVLTLIGQNLLANSAITTQDIKLVNYAQNILITTSIGSGEGVNVQSTALGFINCVLIRSISCLDDRAATLMTNNESLIDYFKHVIHEEPLFNERAVFCVSLLNYSSALMNIQTVSKLQFNTMAIKRLLKMTSDALVMSVKMFLWSSIFYGNDVGAGYIVVDDDSRTADKFDRDHLISTRNIRSIFVMLQNSVVRELEVVEMAAATFMHGLLMLFLKEGTAIRDHLVYRQPWNGFLLRFIISQCSPTVTSAVTGIPPLSLSRLRVCDLLFTLAPEQFSKEQCNMLLEFYCHLDTTLDPVYLTQFQQLNKKILSVNSLDCDNTLITRVQERMAASRLLDCTMTSLETYQQRSQQVAAIYLRIQTVMHFDVE